MRRWKPLHCLHFVLKTSSAITCFCHYYIRLKIALSDQFPFKKRWNVMTDQQTTLIATMFRWELKLPGCTVWFQMTSSAQDNSKWIFLFSSVHQDLFTIVFFIQVSGFILTNCLTKHWPFFFFLISLCIILTRLSMSGCALHFNFFDFCICVFHLHIHCVCPRLAELLLIKSNVFLNPVCVYESELRPLLLLSTLC